MSLDSCDLEGVFVLYIGNYDTILSAKMSPNLRSRSVILGALALSAHQQEFERRSRSDVMSACSERRSIGWRSLKLWFLAKKGYKVFKNVFKRFDAEWYHGTKAY